MADKPTAEEILELEAKAQAAQAELAAAQAARDAPPPLTLEQAQELLEKVEGPAREREHAQIALNQLNGRIAMEQDEEYLEILKSRVPDAEKRLAEATAAWEKAGFTDRDIALAAQAVIDARPVEGEVQDEDA